MKRIIKEIKILIEKDNLKEAKTLYQCHAEELKRYIASKQYISIKWHLYQWYNKLFLTMFTDPWIFGTFSQWKWEKRQVKKWEHGVKISVPIFDKIDKDKIKFVMQKSIFNKSQTEVII